MRHTLHCVEGEREPLDSDLMLQNSAGFVKRMARFMQRQSFFFLSRDSLPICLIITSHYKMM